MSLFTNLQTDAENQKLYLAVVNDSGVEQVAYGKVELKLGDIRTILAATTPTAVSGAAGDEPANVKFREIQVCLDDGTQGYAIFLCGGFYKKP